MPCNKIQAKESKNKDSRHVHLIKHVQRRKLVMHLGIICRWNYYARHFHWNWVKLKRRHKRIHGENNSNRTKVHGCFHGLFDGGEPKHKSDWIATDQKVALNQILIEYTCILTLTNIHSISNCYGFVQSMSCMNQFEHGVLRCASWEN